MITPFEPRNHAEPTPASRPPAKVWKPMRTLFQM
jgi:hypothetical protein